MQKSTIVMLVLMVAMNALHAAKDTATEQPKKEKVFTIETKSGQKFKNPKITKSDLKGYLDIYVDGKKKTVALSSLKPMNIETVTNMKKGIIGQTYKDATINSITPAGISISFSGGGAGIKFDDMAPATKNLFLVDKKAADSYQKKMTAGRQKFINEANERRKKEIAENKKSLISASKRPTAQQLRDAARRKEINDAFLRMNKGDYTGIGDGKPVDHFKNSSGSTCPKCKGTKRFRRHKCPFCKGTGRVSKKTKNRLTTPVRPNVKNTIW